MKIELGTFYDGDGTWIQPYVLIAIIICAVLLTLFTIFYVYRLNSISGKKVKIKYLITAYLGTPFIQSLLATEIANLFFAPPNSFVGVHLLWGKWKDIILTVFFAPLTAIAVGLIFLLFLKNKNEKKQ